MGSLLYQFTRPLVTFISNSRTSSEVRASSNSAPSDLFGEFDVRPPSTLDTYFLDVQCSIQTLVEFGSNCFIVLGSRLAFPQISLCTQQLAKRQRSMINPALIISGDDIISSQVVAPRPSLPHHLQRWSANARASATPPISQTSFFKRNAPPAGACESCK